VTRLGVVLVGVLVSACALDSGTAPTAQGVPQMVLRDFRQTRVDNQRLSYQWEGLESASYPSTKTLQLKDVRFREYDFDGHEVTEVSVPAATVHTETNDVEVTGGLEARSMQGLRVSIRGTISWKSADRVLSSADAWVDLTRGASRVQGRGLVWNLETQQLELKEGVAGTWATDTDANTTSSPPLPESRPSSAGR